MRAKLLSMTALACPVTQSTAQQLHWPWETADTDCLCMTCSTSGFYAVLRPNRGGPNSQHQRNPVSMLQDAGQAEKAMADANYRHAEAKQASTDIEDLAPATPTNTVAAPLIQTHISAVNQHPAHALDAASPVHMDVSNGAKHGMHAELGKLNCAEQTPGPQFSTFTAAMQHPEVDEHAVPEHLNTTDQSRASEEARSQATTETRREAICISSRETMNKALNQAMKETINEAMNEAMTEAMCKSKREEEEKATNEGMSEATTEAMTEARCESKRDARCAEDLVASLLKLGKTLNDAAPDAPVAEDRCVVSDDVALLFTLDHCRLLDQGNPKQTLFASNSCISVACSHQVIISYHYNLIM